MKFTSPAADPFIPATDSAAAATAERMGAEHIQRDSQSDTLFNCESIFLSCHLCIGRAVATSVAIRGNNCHAVRRANLMEDGARHIDSPRIRGVKQ